MVEIGKDKFLIGYQQASEFVGVPVRRIQRAVERRSLRVIKLNSRTVIFHPAHLLEDIMALEVERI